MGIKQIAYVVLALAIIAGIGAAYKAAYSSGFNAAVIEQQEMAIGSQNDAIDAARIEWESTIVAAEEVIRVETKIVEVIKYVEKEIRVVETPDCSNLGPDFLRVFNEIAIASNGGEIGGADAASKPNDPVSENDSG